MSRVYKKNEENEGGLHLPIRWHVENQHDEYFNSGPYLLAETRKPPNNPSQAASSIAAVLTVGGGKY
jgi:hypothetical protein